MEITGYKLINNIEGFDCKVGDIITNKEYFPLYKNHKDFEVIYKNHKEIMEKKITSYIAKPEFNSPANIIIGTDCFVPNSLPYDKAKQLLVLDLWFEPVYEEEKKEKEFTLHCVISGIDQTFNLTVRKDGFFYKPDNKVLDPSILIDMIRGEYREHLGYDFYACVSHLSLGCKKSVPVEDIKPLIDYWKELNK